MQLNRDLQEALRERARQGATVVELIRLIRASLELEQPGEGRLLAVAYLSRTFAIPLDEATEIAAWEGFEDGNSRSDVDLENALGAYLRGGKEP